MRTYVIARLDQFFSLLILNEHYFVVVQTEPKVLLQDVIHSAAARFNLADEIFDQVTWFSIDLNKVFLAASLLKGHQILELS